MNAAHLGALIGAAITLFLCRLLFRKRTELPEATPYQFEKDKEIPNANETFRALIKFRCEIDNAKREGVI